MSTTSQPESSAVLRRLKDGTRIYVPCPMSIVNYNTFMGSVDRGDQVRGYYSCRTKCRKYIFYFLLDVVIMNVFILQNGYCDDAPFSSIKEFRLSELIGDYCSRRRAVRSGGVVPSRFPTTIPVSNSTSEHATPDVIGGPNAHLVVLAPVCGVAVSHGRAEHRLLYVAQHIPEL